MRSTDARPASWRANLEQLAPVLDLPHLLFVLFWPLYGWFCWGVVRGRTEAVIAAFLFMLVIFCVLRGRRTSLALIFASGFAFFAAGEIYVRLTYFGWDAVVHPLRYVPAYLRDPVCRVEFDPSTYTGLRPQAEALYQGKRLRTNSLGFRDAERTYARPAGTDRVLVVGSSLAMGLGVEQGECWPAQTEAVLDAQDPGRRHEVINLAVEGYSARAAATVLEAFVPRFQPDVIIVEADLLDLSPTYMSDKPGYAPRTPAGRWWVDMVRHRDSFFFFCRALRKVERVMRGAALKGAEGEGGAEVGPGQLDAYLRRLREAAGTRPLFVVDLSRQLPADALRAAAARFDIQVIDLLATAGSRATSDMIYPGDDHPNAAVHARYAAMVAEAVRPSLPRRPR